MALRVKRGVRLRQGYGGTSPKLEERRRAPFEATREGHRISCPARLFGAAPPLDRPFDQPAEERPREPDEPARQDVGRECTPR